MVEQTTKSPWRSRTIVGAVAALLVVLADRLGVEAGPEQIQDAAEIVVQVGGLLVILWARSGRGDLRLRPPKD